MKIILSTYNYYPANSGGTEVYTKGLGNYLVKTGHEVVIIASAASSPGIENTLLLEDEAARAIQYRFEGLTVAGITLKDQSIDAIYAFGKQGWTDFFRKLLPLLGFDDAGLLLLNGMSGVSGLSLAEAFHEGLGPKKSAVIVHTPFFCAKGDLLFANSGRKCQETISPLTCASCQLASRSGWNYRLLRFSFPFIKTAARLTGRYLVGNMDRLFQQYMQDLEKMEGLSDTWISFSNDMADFLKKQPFATHAKLKVLRHGIDTALFNDKGKSLPAATTFVYAGRFEKIKGVATLAEAWLLTPDDKAKKQLLLAGSWDKNDIGKQVHDKLSGRGDVQFLGNLSQASLAALYKNAHCVVVPSQWIETGPLVIHEAIASGCDVITSDIGGQNELAGWYAERTSRFECGEPKSLANAILQYRPATADIAGRVWDQRLHYEKLAGLLT